MTDPRKWIRFDWSVNLGSIIMLAAFLGTIGNNWITVKTDIADLHGAILTAVSRIDLADHRIESIEAEQARATREAAEQRITLSNRLTGLEIGQSTSLSTLKELRDEIHERGPLKGSK